MGEDQHPLLRHLHGGTYQAELGHPKTSSRCMSVDYSVINTGAVIAGDGTQDEDGLTSMNIFAIIGYWFTC